MIFLCYCKTTNDTANKAFIMDKSIKSPPLTRILLVNNQTKQNHTEKDKKQIRAVLQTHSTQCTTVSSASNTLNTQEQSEQANIFMENKIYTKKKNKNTKKQNNQQTYETR